MLKKRILFVMVCLCLITAGVAAAQDQPITFKAPEDAVTYYLQALIQGDLEKMLHACALDEMSTHFKFDAEIDRLKAFAPVQSMAPADYPMFAQINKAQITSQLLSQVKIFTYSLLSSQDFSMGNIFTKYDAAKAATFAAGVDPKQLAEIVVKKIATPNEKLMKNDKMVATMTANAQIYGADEATERMALIAFKGKFYIAGFTLLRYGDSWKIQSAYSVFAGTTPVGAASKTTEAEFEKVIAGN